MNKILVPFNFSAKSNHALHFAIQVAEKVGAQISLFHIISTPDHTSLNVTSEMRNKSFPSEHETVVLKRIEQVGQQLKKLKDNPIYADYISDTAIAIRSAHLDPAEIIAEQEADLIVMGNKEEQKPGLFRSEAERLVITASCPIITIKQKTTFYGIGRMLYCSHFEDDHPVIAGSIVNFARKLDATLHLVNVQTDTQNLEDFKVQNRMDAFAKRHRLEKFEIDVLHHSNVEECILDFSQVVAADLIAIDVPKVAGWQKALRWLAPRTVAEKLTNHSEQPVLTHSLSLEAV